jgi:cysteinyl-tRNA synthetase
MIPEVGGVAVGSFENLHLHNALSGEKEPFRPIRGNQARMYVCGPTVYDASHMGHARSYVVFDVLSRYLRFLGYDVKLVINFTDVEEKITERAESMGEDPLKFAEARIQEYLGEMDALGIGRADHYPRVSEYVQEMIETVERLVETGVAYHLGGKIFFDVAKAGGYGGLLHGSPHEVIIFDEPGEGVGDGRRSPFDFELWDGTVEKDPTWESPWGRGRIGWHVECYVMSRILGHPFDIKGGGADLIFPHHESTRLISLALGEDLSRFYVHNAFLTFQSRKMSKSRGVYVTIREALERHSPQAIRLYILRTHYREDLAFSEDAIREASRYLAEVGGLVQRLESIAGTEGSSGGEVPGHVERLEVEFRARMCDDLDTPGALGALERFVKTTSDLDEIGPQDAGHILAALDGIGSVLGLTWKDGLR